MTLKSRRLIYLLLASGGILALAGLLVYQAFHRERPPARTAPSPSPYTAQSDVRVTGIHMAHTDSETGKLLYTANVGSLQVSRKKVGFFRVGGTRELELYGLRMDYYEQGAGDRVKNMRAERDEAELGNDLLSSFQRVVGSLGGRTGRITSFEARKVHISYHLLDGTVTELSGDLLDVERGTGLLRLQGQAEVRHGNRSLTAREILVRPKGENIFARGGYILTRGEARQEGTGIQTDLRLQSSSGS
jgi:hypothetical protein